jgi:hypothetical protein
MAMNLVVDRDAEILVCGELKISSSSRHRLDPATNPVRLYARVSAIAGLRPG